MKITLSKTFTHEGKEHKELNLPIEEITVVGYEKAEREFKALNPKFAGILETETGFLKIVAAKAMDVSADFFDTMPVHEFMKIKMQVQSFLLTGTALEI